MKTIKDPADLGEFADNMKELAGEYYSLQKRIIRLTAVRYLAKTGGAIIDGMIRIILLSIVLLFACITGALWLSRETGSYLNGFALMTIIILGLSVLIHLARKTLFINPIVHSLVRKLHAESDLQNITENEQESDNQHA